MADGNVRTPEEQLNKASANRADVQTAASSMMDLAKNPAKSSQTEPVGHAAANI